MEQMLGSYGPHPKGEAYTKNFDPEESPSGMLARSGTYHVRSRVVDDDGEVYAGMRSGSLSSQASSELTISSCRLGMVVQDREGMVNNWNKAPHACICPVASIPRLAYLCLNRNCIGSLLYNT